MISKHISSKSNLQRFVARRIERIPRVGSRVIDAKVETMIKEGLDIVCPEPYPSRPLPEHIIEAVERAVREPINPPSRGLPEFREALAARLSSELSISIDPESQVLATSGGMHALYIVFSALINKGDEVLVPSPCYFLEGIIEPLGSKIVYAPMRENENYRWNFDLIESKVSSKTKLVFLNTPVNPTGYVLTDDDLKQISRIANEHDLLVVADESYDKLVYDGLKHLSIVSIPGMQDRTILIRSLTKSYAMPSWRVGYIIAPADLIEHFTKVLEWMMLYGSYVSQKAATAAIAGPQDWLEDVASEFQANRDFMFRGINEIEGLSCVKPQGGPFLFINVSSLRGSCDEISDILLDEFGVPTVPGTYFHSNDHIRIAFGGIRGVLEEVLRRLELAVKHIGTE